MVDAVDFGGRPFHFIGIGGIGMSALARIVAELNLPVSGSDTKLSHITEQLQSLGAKIFASQTANNLELGGSSEASSVNRVSPKALPTEFEKAKTLPQVICSTAIQSCNEEYQAALKLGCPIFHRSDLLAALMTRYKSIAVAGTHGKTTTSGLIGYLLYQAELDPTLIIGGEVNGLGSNARLGHGTYLVAEADESDGSLVKFAPHIGIVTNIELDHPDHYASLDQLIGTFKTFEQRSQVLIGCIDCATVRDQLSLTISYSLDSTQDADYTVDQVEYHGWGSTARIWERGQPLGTIKVKLLGAHNLSNVLAVIATARYIGLSFEQIADIVGTFEGVRRRFEYRGSTNGITLIDDYAHHPSELLVTLAAARLQLSSSRLSERSGQAIDHGYQRLVAIFQPHRYSRTEALLSEFAQAFTEADVVVLCDIYSAGETNPTRMTGQHLVQATQQHHSNVHYCPSMPELSTWLMQNLRPGDLALFLGAGNLNQIIPTVLERLTAVA